MFYQLAQFYSLRGACRNLTLPTHKLYKDTFSLGYEYAIYRSFSTNTFTAAPNLTTSFLSGEHTRTENSSSPSLGVVAKFGKEYEAVSRELELLSRDDFARRLHFFSRNNFDSKHCMLLHAHLMELLRNRLPNVTDKVIHDYIRLAYLAGFHELSLAIFHARYQLGVYQDQKRPDGAVGELCNGATLSLLLERRGEGSDASTAAAASSALQGTRSVFVVSKYTIDSAYALQRHAELVHLASYCAHYLREGAAISSSTPETMTYFSLLRCFWRTVCLSEIFSRVEANDSDGSAPNRGKSKQALADARYIVENHVALLFPGNDSMLESARAQRLDSFLRSTQRAIKYDTSGDQGEMLFFKRCVELGLFNVILLNRQSPIGKGGNDPVGPSDSAAETQFGVLPHEEYESVDEKDHLRTGVDLDFAIPPSNSLCTSDIEFVYAHLISTCAAGKHTATAMAYLDAARKSLGLLPIPISGLDSAYEAVFFSANPSGNSGNKDTLAFSSTSHRSTSTQGDGTLTMQPSVSEYVLYRLLHVLQITHDNRRIIGLARAMLRECGATGISISVWSIFLVAAGELRATDVALKAYHIARNRLQQDSGASMPSVERRRYKYLLQTSLNTLSKCQVKNFELHYLFPCQESGLLHSSEEFYFCCLLQDAHNSLDPIGQCKTIRKSMSMRDVPLTPAIVSRLLKLYLRVESCEFFETYRHAVQELNFFKPVWLDSLLLWADRRRYFLTQEERAYIISEVRRIKVTPKDQSTDSGSQPNSSTSGALLRNVLGGLRTQYALIEYDYHQQPLKYFLKHREPPPVEPTLLDSRMHFLIKKTLCVVQGLAGTLNIVEGESPLSVIADPVRRAEIAHRASLVGPPPLLLGVVSGGDSENHPEQSPLHDSVTTHPDSSILPVMVEEELQWQEEAFRVYLSYMLEGLQKSRNFM